MFCIKCGTELPDIANFCYNCATPTKSVSDKINYNIEYSLLRTKAKAFAEKLSADGDLELTNTRIKFKKNQPRYSEHILWENMIILMNDFDIELKDIKTIERGYNAKKFIITTTNIDYPVSYEVFDDNDWAQSIIDLIAEFPTFKENNPGGCTLTTMERVLKSGDVKIKRARKVDEPLKLILTDTRLVFINTYNAPDFQNIKYSSFEYNKYKYEIPLNEIKSTNDGGERMYTPFKVTMFDGTRYNFELQKRKEWKIEIDKAIKNLE